MKYRFKLFIIYCFILTTIISSCSKKEANQETEYNPATKELVALMNENPEVKALLVASIEQGKKINPDPKTNPVQSLEDYLDFISYGERAMPWTLMRRPEYSEIFENIMDALGCFYFIVDQPLPELNGRGYYNSIQYVEPFATWLVRYSKSWGSYLDTEDSWNDEYLKAIQADPEFGLQNGWYEDPSNWKTFNDFFTRYLSSPEARPIADLQDNSVVTSYGDSQPMGVWDIDENSNLVEDVAVKLSTINSIAGFIGSDSEYSDAFGNGTFTHSFLNVQDYHRYHFPIGGVIKEARIINGINPGGGRATWDAKNGRYAFDPSAVGWQALETRGCVIIETEEYGLVALLPIGMAVVNSVNFEENIKPGTKVKKGDMLGYFAFGGSDFVMIFQDGVEFTLEAPKEEDGDSYRHMLMGERLGSLTKK